MTDDTRQHALARILEQIDAMIGEIDAMQLQVAAFHLANGHRQTKCTGW